MSCNKQTLNAQHSTFNFELRQEFSARSDFHFFSLVSRHDKIAVWPLITFSTRAKRLRPSSLDVERWTLSVGRFLLLPR